MRVSWCFCDTTSQLISLLYFAYKQEMTVLTVLLFQFLYESKHLKGESVSPVQRSQDSPSSWVRAVDCEASAVCLWDSVSYKVNREYIQLIR